MRLSFDLDDTLVCGPNIPSEPTLPWWLRWRYRERVRRGTKQLMQSLAQRGCRLWVYTTSYRSDSYLRGWFRALGINLDGVVNQARHMAVVGPNGPSKLPSAFHIDLHVDDSAGVGIEGQRHGFRVLVVAPEDADWATRVLEAVIVAADQTQEAVA